MQYARMIGKQLRLSSIRFSSGHRVVCVRACSSMVSERTQQSVLVSQQQQQQQHEVPQPAQQQWPPQDGLGRPLLSVAPM
jgi:hypothetical protein